MVKIEQIGEFPKWDNVVIDMPTKSTLPCVCPDPARPSLELDDATRVEIAALTSEMNVIFHANSVYWLQGEAATLGARAEYLRRLDRLEEIRTELAHWRSLTHL